jgi:hypothetical protein
LVLVGQTALVNIPARSNEWFEGNSVLRENPQPKEDIVGTPVFTVKKSCSIDFETRLAALESGFTNGSYAPGRCGAFASNI